MLELTDKVFNDTIKDGIAVVDFYATWCGACKMLAPVLEQLAAKEQKVTWAKVNVDEQQSLAAKFGISALPTLVYFKNGHVVKTTIGFQPAAEIEKTLASL